VKRLIERAEQHREVYLSLRDEVGIEDARKFDLPSVRASDTAAAATGVRNWLNLGTNPNEKRDFTNYREAVEAKGILVLRSMGYVGAWRFPKESSVIGFSLFYEVCPIILIRKQAVEARQTFTLMHELGHLILHRKSSIVVESNLWARQGGEREANAFAGNLLVPDAFLAQVTSNIPRNVSDYEDWLRIQRMNWGVSTEVILRRLVDAGRLPTAQYEVYRRWKADQPAPQTDEGGSRTYRYREPIHLFGQRYVRTVLDALNSDRITLHKASGFLDNLKIGDVRELEKHIAGI
jgi:Zn-dependent peptidase ImmA (M78 family)